MGQILIRNLDDNTIAKLKQRASDEGISLEESLRRALTDLAKPDKAELLAAMDRIARMGKPITEPPFSEDLIREDRDGGEDGRYRR